MRDIIAGSAEFFAQYHPARSRGWNLFSRIVKDVRNHGNILTLVSGHDLLPHRRQ